MSPIPREQLQAAFDALLRNGITLAAASLDDALHDPLASRLVHMHAQLRARGVNAYPITVQRPQVHRPEPPHWAPPHGRQTHLTGLDHKRAAAGERDDD